MAHLLCNPYLVGGVQPTHFRIYIDGVTTPVDTPVRKNADNSVDLYYDLASLTAGSHNVNVSAAIIDVWGVSESSTVPLAFTKRDVSLKPGSPVGIGLG